MWNNLRNTHEGQGLCDEFVRDWPRKVSTVSVGIAGLTRCVAIWRSFDARVVLSISNRASRNRSKLTEPRDRPLNGRHGFRRCCSTRVRYGSLSLKPRSHSRCLRDTRPLRAFCFNYPSEITRRYNRIAECLNVQTQFSEKTTRERKIIHSDAWLITERILKKAKVSNKFFCAPLP